MREYCLRCSTHQMFVGLPTTPSAASKAVTSGSSPAARSKQNSRTGAGGLRMVFGRTPASFSSAVRGLGGCGGGATSRPHSAHWTQCECQRWNVPRRTQSSSIVLSQPVHTSESAVLGTGLLEGEGGQKGESPAYSSARLRYPYFTPLVPATPPSSCCPWSSFNRRPVAFPRWTSNALRLSKNAGIDSSCACSRSSLSAAVRAMRMSTLR